MKTKYFLSLFILILFDKIEAQDITDLLAKKKELEVRSKIINDSIVVIDNRIAFLKSRENISQNEKFVITTVRNMTELTDKYLGKNIGSMYPGDTVRILDWEWWYLKVEYKDKVGFASVISFNMTPEVELYIKELEIRFEEKEKVNDSIRKIAESNVKLKIEQTKIALQKARESEIKTNFKSYGSVAINNIINGKVWIGMTDEMARYSWGNPDKINKTVNKYSVNEQWIYNGDYLYFKNGILESYSVSDR